MSNPGPAGRVVLSHLRSQDPGRSARQIASNLKMERSLVNRALYEDLLPKGLVIMIKGTPPLWSNAHIPKPALPEPVEDSKEPINIIFVDLGNIHDILPLLEPYADDRTNIVYAFADRAFSGYGIRPPPTNRHIQVLHATDDHKNAADTEMIWKAAEVVLGSLNTRYRFLIFTRDQGFRGLSTILKRYPVVEELHFVQRWEQVRDWIE